MASFIGDSTLLPVIRIDEHTVRLGDQTLRSAKPITPHAELLLAIQTEKLLIDDGQHEPGINRLPCRIMEAVYQGDSLRLFLELEGGISISLRQPSHHAARLQIPPLGERLSVVLHPEDTIIVPRSGCPTPATNVA